jgi:GAF domain-containing protein
MPCPTCGSELAATADPAALAAETARLARELADAREQQAAMGEILRVISSSPADVSPVFSVIAKNAVRLCNARFGAVYSYGGTLLHFVAGHGLTHEARQLLQHQYPIPPRGLNLQAITERGVVHAVDVLEDRRAANLELARTLGYRSNLIVPMLRADRVLGTINVFGVEPKPFSESQIALLQTFAVQAVIAIENARLFEAEQARTRELTEALENQTATAEILRVIATSPTAIQPVLEAVVRSAARLCQAYDAVILLREGDSLALGAHNGPIPIDFAKYPLNRLWTAGRAIVDRKTIHIRDLAAEVDEYPEGSALAVRLGHRSIVSTPLMREGEAIGVLVLRRTEVLPFSDKQIALLQTFADQAVIAINNVRLFQEVQARTRELTEALEHQSATSEVLGVISRSPNELQPVLDAIVQTAATLCTAESAFITRFSDNQFVLAAANRVDAEHIRYIAQHPISIGRGSITGRVALDRRVIHVADVLADPEFDHHEWQTVGRQRTVLGVPLLLERSLIGVMILYRTEVAPFTDKQVELVETFADQAVIAIENARLFEEVQARTREVTDALEQQTATSKILSAISGSPGQLDPVFDMLLASARELCEAEFGHLLLFNGETWSPAALHNLPQAYAEFWNSAPVIAPSDSLLCRILDTRQWYQIVDTHQGPAYKARQPLAIATVELGGARTLFGVPLLKEGRVIGAIVLYRKEVRPFQPKQIALLSSFADQAVIAIENARLFEEVQQKNRALTVTNAHLGEALQQQVATAEILRVISSSPTDVQPVFQAIGRSATRLCGSAQCVVTRYDGELMHLAAHEYIGTEGVDFLLQFFPARPDRQTYSGRAILDCAVACIEDIHADPEYLQSLARSQRLASGFAVPILHAGQPLGAIALGWTKPRAYTEKQIKLIQTFADQAVIAIENARLFEELQARTRELSESLLQQTATADVLKTITRSAFDLQKVLDTLAESATRLCDADHAWLFRREGEAYHWAASFGHSKVEHERVKHLMATRRLLPGRGTVVGRALLEGRPIQITDVLADPEYTDKEAQKAGQYRSLLGAPLLREGVPIGAIALQRTAVKPFTPKQIALVETFADQAVIAIENARLFEEVQARTRELTEALEQQTATSEVLSVISRSPGDLEPVFQAMLQNATRICEANFALLLRAEGDAFRTVALHGVPPVFAEERRRNPMLPPNPETALGRMTAMKHAAQIADIEAEPAYRSDPTRRALLSLGGARTVVAVPMLKEDKLLGAIVIYRQEVRPFTDKQIALVTSFAKQAVIAIENARLLDELQARTRELARSVEELRALGEVGQTINSTLDMSRVLQTVLENACTMAQANSGTIYVFDKASGEFHLEAGHNMSDEHIARVRAHPIRLGDPVVGEFGQRRESIQIDDLGATTPTTPLIDLLVRAGVRAVLAVPLLHQGEVVGALVVRRPHAGGFTADTVSLLEAFAAQSAIAIHNARLFHEIEAKGREIEIASRHKSQFVANMSHELRTPLAAMLGYAELLQENIYGALPAKATPILGRIQSNGKHLLGLINTVLDISKIESGQFKLNLSEYALSSMVETVRVATESLAAAKKLTFKTEVEQSLPRGFGDEQRLTQVLLNLVGNAIKFTDRGEVRIQASIVDGRFNITVSDTGPGIPPEERDKVFEKFHQIDNSNTKAKGGTGLGLAIAKEIVEMHGGRIWVESTLGHGATFHLELPVRAAAVGGSP